jgi:RNA polymerase sigma factor (sigma-70 family)
VDDAPRQAADDARLTQAALAGDKDAFAALVTRHWPTAVALATRVLGSADLARDAAQEAAVAAMVGLDRLRAPGRFGAWFCGITLNVARRWARQLRAELPAGPAEQASADPGPGERAELADLAAAVRAAVAQLPEGQRRAVLLFYLQGLTHREVAAELAISVGAVKARLHQARAALSPTLTPLITTHEEAPMMTAAASRAWSEVSVAEIRRSEGDDLEHRKHIIVLAESGGSRRLPIWVGPAEAVALAVTIESRETPRPMTHQLAARLLDATGSRATEVRITRLTDQVFYAVIVVDGPGGQREVDARPSDAVNLALIAGVPIRVDSAMLGDKGITEHSDWRAYPVGTAAIAEEAEQRRAESLRERR